MERDAVRPDAGRHAWRQWPVAEASSRQPWQSPALGACCARSASSVPEQIGATFLGDAALPAAAHGDDAAADRQLSAAARPTGGRASLSDPGYGRTRRWRSTTDGDRSRRARSRPFSSSCRSSGQLWPAALIDRRSRSSSISAIDEPRVLGGRPSAAADRGLHALLTATPLSTLPLWILGSDDVKQAIAWRRPTRMDGAVAYVRGLSALAAREFLEAAAALRQSSRSAV